MVIILFRGTSLKYFSDLNSCLLLCFVCVSRKAGIVRTFLVYSANGIGNLIFQLFLRNLNFHKNQEFHFPPIFQESLSSETLGNRLFSGTRVNLIASNISENSLKLPFKYGYYESIWCYVGFGISYSVSRCHPKST